MATNERRNFMALDDAYEYCRFLEARLQTPSLYKLCAAIRTVDKAVELANKTSGTAGLSADAWSAVRDSLYNSLLTTFGGYFLIYAADSTSPLEPEGPWPAEGSIEFFPEQGRRREDSYRSALSRLPGPTLNTLRYCFAQGRQQVKPADFPRDELEDLAFEQEEEEMAEALLERIYDVCAQEASKGKKRAHQKWWQLYWEADSCQDKQMRQEYRREMVLLQSVWGRPS